MSSLCKTTVLQLATDPGMSPVKASRCVRHAARRLTGGIQHMERVTLRIPKQQIDEVEQMVETGEFPNRSEAIRSAVREMLSEQDTERDDHGRAHGWAKV